jgi:hypothetical protein
VEKMATSSLMVEIIGNCLVSSNTQKMNNMHNTWRIFNTLSASSMFIYWRVTTQNGKIHQVCGGCSKPSLVCCIMPTNLSNLNKPLPQGSLMLGLLELTKTHSSLLKPIIWFVILKLLNIINQLIHQGFFIPHELVGML